MNAKSKLGTSEPITSVTLPDESKLSQLNKGLLIANIQKEMEEPGYTPIGRITKNRKVIQRRQEYCSDVERALNEAELTTALLSETESSKKINEKIYQPEDIINYYNGVFLDQVHQIRDKLFRMISLLLLDLETAQDNQKHDPKKMEYKKFTFFDVSLASKSAGGKDCEGDGGDGGDNRAPVRLVQKVDDLHHRVDTACCSEA